jgi:cobalt-zinc-cadmium resistance protein CzcA
VIFGVGIIILVFLPLMTLQGMEGKMFAPLAFTIAIALFISLVLSLTLTPVLSSYLLKPKAHKHVEGEHGDHAHDKHAEHDAHDTWLIRKLKKPYLRLLELSLNNG